MKVAPALPMFPVDVIIHREKFGDDNPKDP